MKVWPYWLGCWKALTHWRDPTTARHGNFWLLGCPPGPFRSSLFNLDLPDSSRRPMSMPGLVRTPVQQIQQDSQPQASHSTKPPSSRITGTRHVPGENKTFILGPGDRNQLKNIKIITRTIKPSLSREISGNNRLLRFKNTYYIVT